MQDILYICCTWSTFCSNSTHVGGFAPYLNLYQSNLNHWKSMTRFAHHWSCHKSLLVDVSLDLSSIQWIVREKSQGIRNHSFQPQVNTCIFSTLRQSNVACWKIPLQKWRFIAGKIIKRNGEFCIAMFDYEMVSKLSKLEVSHWQGWLNISSHTLFSIYMYLLHLQAILPWFSQFSHDFLMFFPWFSLSSHFWAARWPPARTPLRAPYAANWAWNGCLFFATRWVYLIMSTPDFAKPWFMVY